MFYDKISKTNKNLQHYTNLCTVRFHCRPLTHVVFMVALYAKSDVQSSLWFSALSCLVRDYGWKPTRAIIVLIAN
jgi:hypothetical protein